jgi:glutathione synthase
VLRVPAATEARGNLHVGGRAVKTTLDADDLRILEAIVPTLRSYGQILVGIDVIGGMLTEINITSPTGVRHISKLDGINAAAPILEAIARLARQLGKGATS